MFDSWDADWDNQQSWEGAEVALGVTGSLSLAVLIFMLGTSQEQWIRLSCNETCGYITGVRPESIYTIRSSEFCKKKKKKIEYFAFYKSLF